MGLDIHATWERRCQETGRWINMEDEIKIPVLEACGRELWDHLAETGTRLPSVPDWNKPCLETLDALDTLTCGIGEEDLLVVTLHQCHLNPPSSDTFGYHQYLQSLKLMAWVSRHYELDGSSVRLICWGTN